MTDGGAGGGGGGVTGSFSPQDMTITVSKDSNPVILRMAAGIVDFINCF
jgi:hypothetical protein